MIKESQNSECYKIMIVIFFIGNDELKEVDDDYSGDKNDENDVGVIAAHKLQNNVTNALMIIIIIL